MSIALLTSDQIISLFSQNWPFTQTEFARRYKLNRSNFSSFLNRKRKSPSSLKALTTYISDLYYKGELKDKDGFLPVKQTLEMEVIEDRDKIINDYIRANPDINLEASIPYNQYDQDIFYSFNVWKGVQDYITSKDNDTLSYKAFEKIIQSLEENKLAQDFSSRAYMAYAVAYLGYTQPLRVFHPKNGFYAVDDAVSALEHVGIFVESDSITDRRLPVYPRACTSFPISTDIIRHNIRVLKKIEDLEPLTIFIHAFVPRMKYALPDDIDHLMKGKYVLSITGTDRFDAKDDHLYVETPCHVSFMILFILLRCPFLYSIDYYGEVEGSMMSYYGVDKAIDFFLYSRFGKDARFYRHVSGLKGFSW